MCASSAHCRDDAITRATISRRIGARALYANGRHLAPAHLLQQIFHRFLQTNRLACYLSPVNPAMKHNLRFLAGFKCLLSSHILIFKKLNVSSCLSEDLCCHNATGSVLSPAGNLSFSLAAHYDARINIDKTRFKIHFVWMWGWLRTRSSVPITASGIR